VDPHPPTHQVTGSPAAHAAHAARPPVRTGPLVLALIVVAAVLTAGGLSAAALLKSAGTAPSTPTSARLITVTEAITPLGP
jgi:hypothetical protein